MIRLLLFSVLLTLTACKDVGKANVDSCESWVASMECGTTDFSSLVGCEAYEDYDCDVSDYFNCLSENTTCDEDLGVPDVLGWSECIALAECD